MPGKFRFPAARSMPMTPAQPPPRCARRRIALARSFVEPIGYLDIHMTPFGHRIMPVFGRQVAKPLDAAGQGNLYGRGHLARLPRP
jgi:hypothetical protein